MSERSRDTHRAPESGTDEEGFAEASEAEETGLPGSPAASGEVPEAESEFVRVRREAGENYDRLVRISADFENYKKRVEREKTEFIKYANEELIKDFLSVIDNLERAMDHAKKDADAQGLIQGVEMILKQFKDLLAKYGVREIKALKEPFDPNLHEAMMHEVVDDHDENIVIDEFQKGYILKDRLLRPSMVKVSKKGQRKADVGMQEED